MFPIVMGIPGNGSRVRLVVPPVHYTKLRGKSGGSISTFLAEWLHDIFLERRERWPDKLKDINSSFLITEPKCPTKTETFINVRDQPLRLVLRVSA
jgi:hypothetical protein